MVPGLRILSQHLLVIHEFVLLKISNVQVSLYHSLAILPNGLNSYRWQMTWRIPLVKKNLIDSGWQYLVLTQVSRTLGWVPVRSLEGKMIRVNFSSILIQFGEPYVRSMMISCHRKTRETGARKNQFAQQKRKLSVDPGFFARWDSRKLTIAKRSKNYVCLHY